MAGFWDVARGRFLLRANSKKRLLHPSALFHLLELSPPSQDARNRAGKPRRAFCSQGVWLRVRRGRQTGSCPRALPEMGFDLLGPLPLLGVPGHCPPPLGLADVQSADPTTAQGQAAPSCLPQCERLPVCLQRKLLGAGGEAASHRPSAGWGVEPTFPERSSGAFSTQPTLLRDRT